MKKSKYVKNGETFIVDRERMKELEKPFNKNAKSKNTKLPSNPVFPGTPAKVEPRGKGKLHHSKTRRRKSVVS